MRLSAANIRVGLISTLNTNLGDDLVREGILRIMRYACSADIEPVIINKHHPLEVYPTWHPACWLGKIRPKSTRLTKLLSYLFAWIRCSRFDDCDIIIYAGTPLLWENCHQCEWAIPIWQHIVKRLSAKIPVLILGGGSCYAWLKQPRQIDNKKDHRFIASITSMSKLVTVRDPYAQQLLTNPNHLLPCPAFVAANQNPTACCGKNGYILFNYMKGAGHYDYGQNINHTLWESQAKETIALLQQRGYNVAFLCHNQKEVKLADALLPDLRIFTPQDPEEYASLAKNTQAAICNRLHACVSLAGLGVPSVAVGVDSRLKMVATLGLPIYFVSEAEPEALVNDLTTLVDNNSEEHKRLVQLKKETMQRYIEYISPIVNQI